MANRRSAKKSRDQNNTILHQKFPGEQLTFAGANSPASLASRPIRFVLADEIDRYRVSAKEEGDPVLLAKKRTTTFWNWLLMCVSTPTVKGISRIEKMWEQSDKRRYFVNCPHCEHPQHFVFDRLQYAGKGLCGEVQVTKHKNCYPYVVWEKLAGIRNEPLDTAVYALAAANLAGMTRMNWSSIEREFEAQISEDMSLKEVSGGENMSVKSESNDLTHSDHSVDNDRSKENKDSIKCSAKRSSSRRVLTPWKRRTCKGSWGEVASPPCEPRFGMFHFGRDKGAEAPHVRIRSSRKDDRGACSRRCQGDWEASPPRQIVAVVKPGQGDRKVVTLRLIFFN